MSSFEKLLAMTPEEIEADILRLEREAEENGEASLEDFMSPEDARHLREMMERD